LSNPLAFILSERAQECPGRLAHGSNHQSLWPGAGGALHDQRCMLRCHFGDWYWKRRRHTKRLEYTKVGPDFCVASWRWRSRP